MANYLVIKCRILKSARAKKACRCGAICGLCLVLITLLIVCVGATSGLWEAADWPEVGVPAAAAAAEVSDDPFPKVIHQVWLGYDRKSPPPAWRNATEQSIRTNPDFGYRLWSDGDVIELLTSHYGWFVPTYRRYPYDVERADAARYFIILHHGGVYLDMDEVSVVPISDVIEADRLQRYQCVLPQGTPNGVTNYVIMCKRRSPFMAYVTSRLTSSDGWYGLPYATVMWSTGPRFMSAVYDSYADKASVYVMPRERVDRNFRCLFGQSWFSADGVLLHALVYPFIRMGLSWAYLFVPVGLLALGLARCACRKRNKSAGCPGI